MVAFSTSAVRGSGQAASTSHRSIATFLHPGARSRYGRVRSTAPQFEKAMFGEDFGARDPTPGELASNFSEKVLGNWDTEHIIKPPDAMGNHIGLTSRACRPVSELAVLDDTLRERLRQQAPGWRVQAGVSGVQSIRQDWTAKDSEAAQLLVQRLQALASEQGHALAAADAVGTTVFAELTTPALGGLTENDFVVAAKINQLDIKDLLKPRKQRFWA